MAMEAVGGTIDDNPWAGVPRDPLAEEEDRRKRNLAPPDAEASRRPKGLILEEGCCLQLLDLVAQLSLCLDACFGVFFVVYGIVLHGNHPAPSKAIIWALILGNILLIRSKSVALGLFLQKDSVWSCQRGGLMVAGYLSMGLFLFYGLSALLGQVCSSHVKDYLRTQKLDLSPSAVEYLLKDWYVPSLISLAVLSVLEAFKWRMYIIYHRSIIFLEEEDERDAERDTIRREAATGRPWWWSRTPQRRRPNTVTFDNSLADPLLDRGDLSTFEDTPARSRRRRGFSLWPFGKRRNGDARDDGSVDFASAQEEWASRAEEDPFWWSREEESQNNRNISQITDTSWVQNAAEV
jgi:hypothetical protein